MTPSERIYYLEKALKKLKYQLCCLEDSCPTISPDEGNILSCLENGLFAPATELPGNIAYLDQNNTFTGATNTFITDNNLIIQYATPGQPSKGIQFLSSDGGVVGSITTTNNPSGHQVSINASGYVNINTSLRLTNNAKLGVGSITGNTQVIIAASTTTRSHINLISGVDKSSPENGDIWYNGTNLNFYNGASSIDLIGTVSDGRLSSNIPLLNANNTFTGTNDFADISADSFSITNGVNTLTISMIATNRIAFTSALSSPGISFIGAPISGGIQTHANGHQFSNLTVSQSQHFETTIFPLEGSANTAVRMLMAGNNVGSITLNRAYAAFGITDMGMSTHTTGTHPLISQLAIEPMNLSVEGAATVNKAATLYIQGPLALANPTTTGNWSVFVKAGKVGIVTETETSALLQVGGDIEAKDTGGFVLSSPDTTRFRITVEDDGSLTTTAL